MGVFTNAGAAALLDEIDTKGWYAAPFNGVPGGGGTELSDSTSEGRIAINSKMGTAGSPTAREVSNDVALSWEATGSITVTHIAIYDASSSGNLVAWDDITSADLIATQTLTVNPGQLRFRINNPS